MISNYKREPLLRRRRRELNYFTTDEEFRLYPQNRLLVFRTFKFSWKWFFLVVFFALHQVCFLGTASTAQQTSLFTGLSLQLITAAVAWVTGSLKRTPKLHSLALVGFLDILGFLVVIDTSANIPAASLALLLQTPAALRLFLMKFAQRVEFRTLQYTGAALVFLAVCVNYLFCAQEQHFFLLVGLLVQTCSNLLKTSYLKNHMVDFLSFNAVVSAFGFFFGCVLGIVYLLLFQVDFGSYFVFSLKCLLGLECFLLPFFYLGLVVCTSVYKALFAGCSYPSNKVFSVFSATLSLLAFFITDLLLNKHTGTLSEWATASTGCLGIAIYYLKPEVPLAFSFSNN